jgi:gamma-glutamyltranspeptidase/glutathione hydrolase
MVTGSPGGSRIITTVLQIIINVIDRSMDIAAAVAAPRLHQQWVPDQVYVEPGIGDDIIAALQAGGDKVVAQRPFTSANSIMITPDAFVGAADPRTRGALAVGF